MTHEDFKALECDLFAMWFVLTIFGIGIVFVLEQIRNELRKKGKK